MSLVGFEEVTLGLVGLAAVGSSTTLAWGLVSVLGTFELAPAIVFLAVTVPCALTGGALVYHHQERETA